MSVSHKFFVSLLFDLIIRQRRIHLRLIISPFFEIIFLRGGGVRAFGRTSREMACSRRQTRFLVIFGVLAAVWFILRII